MEIEVGIVIGGKYKLTRLIGRGGMGQVWLARHRTLDQDVAIKLMTHYPADTSGEDEVTAFARFQLEAQVAASLSKRTRNIVAVTDHGYEAGNPYLVMDLLEGEGLDRLLDRERVLAPERVAAIVTQASRGLAVAHAQGVIHRDLKPANVFLTKDEDGKLLVKLLDFGIARLERDRAERLTPNLTGRGIVLGTPHYMSPELARGIGEVDRYCDLWALSVVAYEALTGEMPFEGSTPEDTIVRICTETPRSVRDHRRSLPVALDAFFDRAFSRNVTARFSSAEEMAAAFARAVADEPEDVSAAREATQPIPLVELAEPVPPLPTTSSPRKIALGIIAVIAVLSLAGLALKAVRPGDRVAATVDSVPAATATVVIPSASVESTVTASAPGTASAIPPATSRAPVATTAQSPTLAASRRDAELGASPATATASATASAAPIDKGAIF